MELEELEQKFEMELDELKKRVTALEEAAASTPGAKPSLVIVKDDGSAIRDEQLCQCGKIMTLKTIVSDKNKLTRWFHKPGEACAKVFAELHPK